MPEFDSIDQTLLDARMIERKKRTDPLVGDFVRLLNGDIRRFTYDWDEEIQLTTEGDKFGCSFHMHKNGMGDYSGGLDHAIPKNTLKLTDEVMHGTFWFFHHDHVTGHNGVYFEAPCRVFQQEK